MARPTVKLEGLKKRKTWRHPRPILRLLGEEPRDNRSIVGQIHERLTGVLPKVKIHKGSVYIDNKVFSKFIGVPVPTIESRRKGTNTYTQEFWDGTKAELNYVVRNGLRIGVLLDDAVATLEMILKKKRNFIAFSEIMESTGRSKGWIQNLFKKGERTKHAETIKIELEGEKQEISLRFAHAGYTGRQKPRYMDKKEYLIFRKWVEQQPETEVRFTFESEIPEGYVTTGEAAKLLGFKYSDMVLVRVNSGVLEGKKLEDGRTVVSLEEIERFKRKREELKPPEGSVKVSELYKGENAVVTKHEFHCFLKTEKDEKGSEVRYFPIVNTLGEVEKIRIYKDINNILWVEGKDAKRVREIIKGKEKMFVDGETTADILGISPLSVFGLINKKKDTLVYTLSDGTKAEIRMITDKGKYWYNKEDLTTADEREGKLLKRMRFIDDLCAVFGLVKVTLERKLFAVGHNLKFFFEGINYSIKIKTGKEKRAFVWKEELDVLRRVVTKYGPNAPFENNKSLLENYPEAAELIYENDAKAWLNLVPEYWIVLPLAQEDEKYFITREDETLLELYLKLFTNNGNNFMEKSKVAIEFMDSADPKNEMHIAGLWIIRQFLVRNDHYEEGKEPEEFKRLHERFESNRIRSIVRTSYDEIESRYFKRSNGDETLSIKEIRWGSGEF